ncbi:MAG: phosphoribosylformylglycinamidine synthase subunit PurQ [Saprospirales bacterium]|nr:MAG: phosphoribosylformylglycinamidine synthase subunit PurQ [Saprospirales bacterium]
MKVGVVVFPGSNCDDDMMHVMGDVLGLETHRIWHKDSIPDSFTKNDCIVLPGGFSYGDYLRSGAIARFSPVMKSVVEHAESGGFLFGICNGFQILCEAGLLPGVLLRNKNQLFVHQNTWLKVCSTASLWTRGLNRAEPLKMPVAHADGRYYIDEKGLQQLEENEQILLRYSNSRGELTEDSNFNGSVASIAGICNTGKNVFGMMPHPERAAEEILGNTDGRSLLEVFFGMREEEEPVL